MFTRRNLILSFLILVTLSAGFAALSARAAGELTPKEARKVIARLAGIDLPSDAVRVKSISSFGDAYVVVAQVETAFRVVKGDNDKWRIAISP